jgi:acyl-CoA synthetase (AMP-forming)/AMP-acid ligase II
MTFSADFLLERFADKPDALAFVADDRTYTYRWVLETTPDYEALLNRSGMQPGDVVAFVADYSPEVFCFFLAAFRRDLVLVPMTDDSVVEKDVMLEIAQAQWFVQFSPDIDLIEVTRLEAVPTNEVLTGFLERGNPGLLLFSSGSTGRPKGILHDANAMLEKFRVQRPGVVAITFLMLDHFGGINTLFHITSSLGTVVTVAERTVATICDAIQRHRVQLLPTTPSFLNVLVHAGAAEKYDLSSLRTISYGAEVMPQVTLDRLKALFPDVKLQQTYGLTEVGVLRSKSRDDGSLWFLIGGEGFQTKVVDDILWIKSDYAMVGYLNAPSPFDADGWFNTQDRVEVDGDYVKILGRTSDLINIGGQKVYPSEVEEVIIRLDNVEDVAVFAEKNALIGQIVVAQVVLSTPEDPSDLRRRVRKACAEALASYKVPSKVIPASGQLYSSRQKKVRS